MTDDKIDPDAKGRLEPSKTAEADGRSQANEIQTKTPGVPSVVQGRMPLFRDRMSLAQKPPSSRRGFD